MESIGGLQILISDYLRITIPLLHVNADFLYE